MPKFSFLLRFFLPEEDRDVIALVKRLDAAGCTDSSASKGTTAFLSILHERRRAVGRSLQRRAKRTARCCNGF